MTRVHGDLWLVTDDPAGVNQVVVRAPDLRTRAGGAVTTLPKKEPVTDGKIDITVLPGPAYLTPISYGRHGEAIPIVVPDAESATLESVIKAAEIADTTQRDILEEIAAQITADREATATDRQAVAQDKIAVSELTDRAETAAGDAETHAELAEEKAGIAAEASGNASASEQAAAQSASDAEADRVAAEQASTRAVQAENAATDAATTATNKATEANLAADRAEQATAGKADLIGGKVPTSQIPEVALTKPFPVASRAEMLALDAQEGDIAIISTGADKGSYILGTGLASDFASWLLMAVSADAPVQSVNGQVGTVVLAATDVGAAAATHTHTLDSLGAAAATHTHTLDSLGAAAATHTHTSAQITDATSNATASMVVKRDASGMFNVNPPTATTHPVSKSYVDTGLADVYTDMHQRPALFSGAGNPPSSIPGAVVGDFWLDTTKMELRKIIGV